MNNLWQGKIYKYVKVFQYYQNHDEYQLKFLFF